MPTFIEPPLLSRNTVVASVIGIARALGLGYPALRRLIGLANTDEHRARVFAGYEPSEHDVFVPTYSKSGTNWVMQIAAQIAWRGEAEFEHIHEIAAWPEAPLWGIVALGDPGPWQRCPTARRVIKTSIDSRFVPYREHATYLTVLRDPKDIFASSYRFVPSVFGLTGEVSVEQWLEMFLGPQSLGRSWAQHTAGYWAWRDRPNVLVLCFSDMKNDLAHAVELVAETMKISLTQSEFDRVVERSSFSYMKRHEDLFAPPRMLFARARATMIRGGKVGGSGELLTHEQQAAIDSFCQAELSRLDSDFPYAEKFEAVEV